jgi:hypothetical protein
LPNPSLIPGPAKTADMIFKSSRGICGEDDFRDEVYGRTDYWQGNMEPSGPKGSI